LAIWLTQHKKVAYRRFAYIFGPGPPAILVLQRLSGPAVGYFLLCIFYPMAWAHGIKTYWLRPHELTSKQSATD
jgi:hypothetical protein